MASISLLGYGVVGTGLAILIDKHKNKFKDLTGEDLIIKNILVRNKNKHIDKLNAEILTDNFDSILESSSQIVVEVMGGIHPAYEYIKKALNSKKHVITANKDLIAEHGKELLDLAEKNGVSLNFEASVGGGIPILKPLTECLLGNDILSIQAILNGTTNFILSKMNKEGLNYEDALKLAQELGFAESDPTSDVMGLDAARKLAILSTIAYKKKIKWDDINIEGITHIDKDDFKYAKNCKCNIKLLAISKKVNNKVYASIKPAFVSYNSELSKIDNETNAIIVEGDATGNIIFSGKGAGMLPTASAVFGDISDIIQNKNKKPLKFSGEEINIEKNLSDECNWFLRIATNDKVSTICILSNMFSKCHVFTNIPKIESNDVAAMIKISDENSLNKILENMTNLPYVQSIKKFPQIN